MKDNTVVDTLSMNMERPDASWNPDLAPTKKNSRFELEEELEMREKIELMRGALFPC